MIATVLICAALGAGGLCWALRGDQKHWQDEIALGYALGLLMICLGLLLVLLVGKPPA